MQTYTSSKIAVPFSISLSALPVFPHDPYHLVPSQNYDLQYQFEQSPYDTGGAYSVPFQETSRGIELSDDQKYHYITDFAGRLTNESVDLPQDIAAIIQKEFWNLM